MIPNDVKDVLIGILLGDTHISPSSNSILVYAQIVIKDKEYFYFIYNLFIPFCAKNYIPQSKIIKDNRTNKIYSAISFTTIQLLILMYFE